MDFCVNFHGDVPEMPAWGAAVFLELDLIVAVDCYGRVQGGGLTVGIVATRGQVIGCRIPRWPELAGTISVEPANAQTR
jgi:hypothetical protein